MRLSIDRDTVERARSGDGAQMEALLRAAWPHAHRIAFAILMDRSLAEDAAQEACALVYLRVRQLRTAAAFTAWFYRIVSRAATDALKRHRKARELSMYSLRPIDPPDAAWLDLHAAIADLPLHMQLCLALHYYADLTSDEIGEILGLAAPTVRSHLLSARRKLKAQLDERTSSHPSEVTSHAR